MVDGLNLGKQLRWLNYCTKTYVYIYIDILSQIGVGIFDQGSTLTHLADVLNGDINDSSK